MSKLRDAILANKRGEAAEPDGGESLLRQVIQASRRGETVAPVRRTPELSVGAMWAANAQRLAPRTDAPDGLPDIAGSLDSFGADAAERLLDEGVTPRRGDTYADLLTRGLRQSAREDAGGMGAVWRRPGNNEYRLNAAASAALRQAEELEKERDRVMIPVWNAQALAGAYIPTAEQEQETEVAKAKGAELKSRIDALRSQAEEYSTQARGARYAGLRYRPDFEELSQYRSTANGREPVFNAWSGLYTESGFDDIDYEVINRNEEAMGQRLVNDASSGASALGLDSGEREKMTEEEVATFNYLYAKEGKEAAYAYIDYLTSDLHYRQRKENEEKWAEYAGDSPVGSSVFSVITSPLKGLSYIGQLADYAEDGAIDQNAGYNKFSYMNSAIRDEVSGIVEENWGGAGSFAYGVGMSMADFLFNTAVAGGNQAVSLAIMGTGAAADTTIAAKDRGLSDNQAFALGTIAGAAEIITEKLSLDALFKADWEKGALRYILTNAFTEGAEEVGSDVINLTADILISKEKSEWQMSIDAYMAQGMSKGEAVGRAVGDQALKMGLDFLGGTISGGVISSAASAGNAASNYTTGRRLNQMGLEEGDIQAIIREGLESDPSTRSHRQAVKLQQQVQQGKRPGAYQLGSLYRANAQAIYGEEQAAQREQEGSTLPTAEETESSVEPRTDDMRAEPGMLPTAEQAELQQRLNRADTEVERSGIRAGAREESIQTARRLSDILGRNIRFYDGNTAQDAAGGANGYYDRGTDTIYVNSRSRNPAAQIIAHELTHGVELSDAYRELSGLVLERIGQTGGDLTRMRREKAELYASKGARLDGNTEIDREIVAEYVERYLLTDEQSIRALTRENRSLGQRILSWLNQLLAKLGNGRAQERVFLTKARDAYARALEETQSSFTRETAQRKLETQWSDGRTNGLPVMEDKQTVLKQNQQERAEEKSEQSDQDARDGFQDAQETISHRSAMEDVTAGLREDYAAGRISEEEFDAAMDAVMEEESLAGEEMLERRYSFGGERARNADLEALSRAKEMERQDVAMETIFRETGWYTGADGKWRFEIDDSGMEFRRDGDARLSEEPEYRRMEELTEKWSRAVQDGESLTEQEQAELEQLQERYSELVWEERYRLDDFLKHDALFRAYPRLRGVSLVFDGMSGGEKGYFSPRSNTIVLSDTLFGKEPDVLLHEIQHILQRYEGFARGSSPGYWNRRMEEGYSRRWSSGEEMMPGELYRNTAGEIEARDAATRRELTAEERRDRLPDRGDENTVFVEDADREDGRSYSIGENSQEEKLTSTDIRAIQSIGRKSVNDFTAEDIRAAEPFARRYWAEMGVKSPFFRAWFGDWRANDPTPVERATEPGDARGQVRNEDTGWNINVSGKVFNETRAHHFAANRAAWDYLPYINDIIKKAVLLDSYTMAEGKTKSANSLLMHSLYAVADIGSGPELIKLYVEEMNDPNSADTAKRAYQIQAIESRQLSAKGSGKALAQSFSTADTKSVADGLDAVKGGDAPKRAYQLQNIEISSPTGGKPTISSGKALASLQTADIKSVADLFEAVKRADRNFHPKEPSAVTDEEGRPMAVYHGTDRSFWRFDPELGAYWFSQAEDYAQAMAEERGGDRVLSAYLDMKNPMRVSLPAGTFTDPAAEGPYIRRAKAEGYDGVIFQADTDNPLEADTFYAVFRPEQIKSATDNIGTFDRGNRDIRYSISENNDSLTDETGKPLDLLTAKELDMGREDGYNSRQEEVRKDGQGTDVRGVYGEDVRGEAGGTEALDAGGTGEEYAGAAGSGSPDEGGRRAAHASWARGRLIERPSAESARAAEHARRYGADAFVVEDAAIKARNPNAWALTSGGKVYISDSIPAELADVVGFHETIHAAKQRGDSRYRSFLKKTGELLDFGSDRTELVFRVISESRFEGRNPTDLTQRELETAYDELNALVWGFHKVDPENARAQFGAVFQDYDGYIAALDEALDTSRAEKEDAGRIDLPTAEETELGRQYSLEEDEIPEARLPTAEAGEAEDIIGAMPAKARQYLRRAENYLTAKVGNLLSVPRQAQRDYLRDIVREISVEYLRDGKVSGETISELFDRAYDEGVVVDRAFYDQYKELRDFLRTTRLTISPEDSANIPDFNDFRKSNFGRLNISTKGGTNIDRVYQELETRWPEFFSEERDSHPADQLERIAEVAKSFQVVEKNLDEYYGPEAAEYRKWARNDFEAAVTDSLSELGRVRRYVRERQSEMQNDGPAEEVPTTLEEVTALWGRLKEARRTYEKVAARNLLTAHDEIQVGRLLRGEIETEHLDPEKDNVKGIREVYRAKLEYERMTQLLRQWNQSRKAELRRQADRYLETAGEWKDKKAGILYSRETMERNILDIVKDQTLAQEINRTYFTPVHDAQAEATRMKNQYRDRVRALKLSRKVAEGNTVSEAHAVQLLGEAEDNIRILEQSRGRIKERDGKSLEDWRSIVRELWEENPNLDGAKIRAAVQEFRGIYDELFRQMNEARVRNGYEPVNYRSGYFPHFQPGNGDGILAQFGRALGISTEVTALPTTINGLTHTFRPGIRWFGNAQERLGFNTAYDAVEGFDRYIEGVADVIHQTDNIQRLRALSAQARYRTGDEGIRQQIDRIKNDASKTEEDRQNALEKLYETGRFTLSNFVVELEEYTNLLANKKSRADRNMEQALGRNMYNLVKALEGRVAANMVAVNPASWLTNFIPLTQGAALLDRGMLLKGMWDTLRAYKADDGIVNKSRFLTNRRGSDPIVRTWAQKASATASRPMEYIDQFVADSLVRARYRQNLNKGLSEDAAMSDADAWAAGVMADRSKGATPTLFNRSNPMTKVFTQFQLEVNNQLSYLFKDMPRDVKDKGAAALAAALLKFFLGAWLFDEIYEYVIGRRPALDPIGILNDTVGDLTGWELPNLVELGVGAVTGEMPSFQTERAGLTEAGMNLAGAAVEQLPFIGGVLGGGRVPISSAIPDLQNLWKGLTNDAWSGEKRVQEVWDELQKPLTYLALPFGGGQLKKFYESIEGVTKGGSYSVNAEGEEELQYPIYNDTVGQVIGNALLAATFGRTSLPTGREWIESGFETLGAKQTAVYRELLDAGAAGEEAYTLLKELGDVEKTETESEAVRERRLLEEANISGEGKSIVYYGLMASDREQELMDELKSQGTDMGEVAEVLMAIKDAGATMKGADASNAKRDAIAGAALSESEQIQLYHFTFGEKQDDGSYMSSRADDIDALKNVGLSFEQFLKVQNQYSTINEEYDTSSEKAVEFARWVNGQNLTEKQAAAVKDAFTYYSQIPQSGGYYEKFAAAGLNDEDAYDLNEAIQELEPLEGEDQVSRLQRYRAVVDSGISEEKQMAALEALMTESEYGRLQTGYSFGVSPQAYVSLKERLPLYDADGDGSFNREEVEAAIDSMDESRGIALPSAGNSGRVYLTNAQKAALWQMQNKKWKPGRNPYSTSVGRKVYDALNKEDD